MFATPQRPGNQWNAPATPGTGGERPPNGVFINGEWFCNCEPRERARRLQVKKDNHNKDRLFYRCAKGRDQQCSFFEWQDRAEARERETLAAMGGPGPGPGPDPGAGTGAKVSGVIGRTTPPLPEVDAMPTTPTRPGPRRGTSGMFGRVSYVGGPGAEAGGLDGERGPGDGGSASNAAAGMATPPATRKGKRRHVDFAEPQLLPRSDIRAYAMPQQAPAPATPTPVLRNRLVLLSEQQRQPGGDDAGSSAAKKPRTAFVDGAAPPGSQGSQSSQGSRTSHTSAATAAAAAPPRPPPGPAAGDPGISFGSAIDHAREGEDKDASASESEGAGKDAIDDNDENDDDDDDGDRGPAKYDLTESVLGLLKGQGVDAPIRDALRALLEKHELRVRGVELSRDLARAALRSRDACITRLRARVATLERERQAQRDRFRRLNLEVRALSQEDDEGADQGGELVRLAGV